jgi:hypothetical protein
MTATTPKRTRDEALDRCREALDTLTELHDWLPDADSDGWRGSALGRTLRAAETHSSDDPIWTAVRYLLPDRQNDPQCDAPPS